MHERRKSNAEISVLMLRVESILEKMDVHMQQTSRIDERLRSLEVDYNRYRSFLGGIMFILSAFWAFFTFTFDNFREIFSKMFNTH